MVQFDGVDGNVAARPVRGPAAAPARARRAIELDGDGPVLVQQAGPGPDKGIVSAIDGHVSPLGRRYPGDPLLDLLRGAVEPAGHRARPELVTEGPVHRVRVPGQGRADKDQEDQHDHEGRDARRQRPEARRRTAIRRVDVRTHQVEHGYRGEYHGGAEADQDLDAECPTLPLDSR